MIRGQCLCGSVQFSVLAPFEYACYCHCSRCRMASGSAFASTGGVRREQLRIDQGESLRTFQRRGDVLSHFCGTCGSVLFINVRNDEYAHVQLGTLIDDPQIQPQFHIHVASKAAWHTITDALPQFAELPD